ncbi:putative ABC transporter permease subunit [Clostridium polynesiense]|uniref:putative ABC transporter permease subunit n=1 Tax=Clostridium polynesiense TaxID=1325933 RepID=UPI00058F8E02|nr:hypothetical protein [Clostridium polynesiense]
MSRVWTLCKLFMKTSGFGESKNNSRAMALLVVLILGFGLGLPIINLMNSFYTMLEPIGQQGLLVGMVVTLNLSILFIFGIIYVMSTFYFSKDVEFLLPLPLKPEEITLGKFSTVLLYEYLTQMLTFLFPLAFFGIRSSSGVIYWIMMIILFILLPLLPLAMAAILDMVVMSFTSLGKRKELLKLFGGILAAFSGIFINIFITKSMNFMGDDMSKIVELMSMGNNSLVDKLAAAFPTAKSAVNMLLSKDILKVFTNLGIFLILTIAGMLIFMAAANLLYFKGALGGAEIASKRKNLTKSDFGRMTKKRSAFITYVGREIKNLVRTPVYLLNCVIINFMWPVFLIFPLLTGGNDNMGVTQILALIRNVSFNERMLVGIIIIGSAALLGIASMAPASSTAISREGNNAFFMKYIPLSYEMQLMAKMTAGIIVTYATFVFVFIAMIVLNFKLYFLIAFFITGNMAIILSNLIGVLVDASGPKLNWDNEAMAVKQNFRSFAASMGCAALAATIGIVLFNLNLSFTAAFIALVAVFATLIAILYLIMKKSISRWFENIN